MSRTAAGLAGALVAAGALLLAGCGGRDYELNVRLPSDSGVAPNGDVYLDGVRVGKVAEVKSSDGKLAARVVIEDRALAAQKIKPGILAAARKDKGIDLDASRVEADAPPLPRGSTIEGHTRLEFLVRKYAVWQNIIAVAIAIIAQVVMVWTLRCFFKGGVLVVSLIFAAVLAVILHPFAVPAVEWLYTEVDKATEARPAAEPAVGPASERPEGKAPGDPALAADLAQAKTAAQAVEEMVKNIPRPSPRIVAFLGSWLILFLAVQLIMGWAFRATRKGK